jgi:hypothetical protein
LGIDLGRDGITPNDTGDPDSGPNNLQNFPVLTSASTGGGSTTINGSLNGVASTTFRIEFFASRAPDPTLNGEGRTFLGAQDVTTDGAGNKTFTAVLPVEPPSGQSIITATATDPSKNTSEFSNAVQIPGFATSQFLNIATRLRVQTGENVLIGGLIITGSDPKKVMIRGIGPSLSSFFSGTLADPTLELFQSSTMLASNDDWKTRSNGSSQQAEIEATGIPPNNDFESAIVRTLPPGAYTAVLRGKGNTIGIGLVEVYDLDQEANSKLANIATRGFVETDNNVMIGGLIVGPAGGLNAKAVVRAIGPSLSNFGINGTLQDPTLDLVNGNGVIIRSNDNWKISQRAELEALGLQPSDDRESALVETLAPGNYTAVVRGAGNTTGVSLVEVYNVL